MALIERSARASLMYSTSESAPNHRAVDGIETALARIDDPRGIDHRNLRAAQHAGRFPRHRRVILGVDIAGVVEVVDEIVELVFVRHFVDQADAQRILRLERALIDQRADLRFGLLARIGDRLDEVIVLAAIERLAHLAMRGRVGLLEIGVDGGLVIADVEKIRIGADPVERAAQEHLVGRHAGEIERGRRQQVDAIGHRRQEVLAIAGVLEPGVHVLAAGLEILQRRADLLELAPERRAEAARPKQDAADARIALGLANQLDVGTNGQLVGAEHHLRKHFGNVA